MYAASSLANCTDRVRPTNPPKFPIEAIKAMPEAAENPVRNSLGSDQKGPKKLYVPIATNEKRTMDPKREFVAPSKNMAIPATSVGIAAWNRRSSLLSELRETRIIAIKPARWGIITKIPIVVFEYCRESDFTTWGIQKLTA